MRHATTTTLTFAALLAVVLPATPAAAKQRLSVHPGKRAIARVLADARPGAVIRVHAGRYTEAPVIDKRLKLVAVGRGRPLIDARCRSRFTIEVDANGVKLVGLKVIGADGAPGTVPSEVDFSFVSNGVANDVVLRDTCDAEYGVNVYSADAVDVRNSRALGFDDAGFYVGGIAGTPRGPIRIRRNEAYGNNRGVIVEASEGGEIRVEENALHDNNVFLPPPASALFAPTGLLVNEADGVLIQRNEVTHSGVYGLRLTPGSDGNVINENEFLGNPVDVFDEGAGNCGSDNAVETGDAIPPC